MFPPHHLGGYELTWASSVAHLRGAGHEVRVLTTDHRSPSVSTSAREASDVHRELHWYWHEHDFPPIGVVDRVRLERHNARVLGDHLRDLRPDVVAWWAMGGMSLALIERVRRAGIPAVGVVGDLWMLYGPRVDGWTRALGRLALPGRLAALALGLPGTTDLGGAARWLFASEHLRERCLAERGPLADTALAHPGVDLGAFAAGEQRPWRGRLLYAGRLDERKGVHVALDALESLPPTITLRVVGSGDPSYARLLAGRGAALEGRLELTPQAPQRELAEIYAGSDALVFPVLWPEPWGLVPLEAMACGTPVVATGTGGSAEYLRDGENCLLFEPGDAEGLAEAVRRLAGDAALRSRLRRAGLETAARYGERDYNEAIERALVEVAAG
jgi:glycosyltransferase involved in cell wall biosynthesis